MYPADDDSGRICTVSGSVRVEEASAFFPVRHKCIVFEDKHRLVFFYDVSSPYYGSGRPFIVAVVARVAEPGGKTADTSAPSYLGASLVVLAGCSFVCGVLEVI